MHDQRTKDCVVVEGKNVEEAMQAACDRLNTTPNQVEHTVEEAGKGGVLGFLRGRTVRVRVWKKSDSERMIAEIVKGLFEHMQMPVEHRVTQGEDAYEVELETKDSDGLLIGRGGETLKALQHLISRMVGQRDETLRVRVDVAGYRRRRHEQLRRKAQDLAERAVTNRRDALSEPLPADERRIVHLALTEDPRVETRAVGDGPIKRVAVVAVGQRGSGGSSGGEGRSRRDRPSGRSRDGSRSWRDDRRRGGEPRERSSRPSGPGRRPAVTHSDERLEPSPVGARDDGDARGRGGNGGWAREDRLRREAEADTGAERKPSREERAPSREERAPSREEQAPSREERAPSREERAPSREETRKEATAPSYFNIPPPVEKTTEKGGHENGEAADGDDASREVCWGRRRRPARRRR